jgi:hypothetical protein
MTDPLSIPVDGTRRVLWLATTANINAVTTTEANAGIKLDRYLTGDGWMPAGDQETIKDGRLRSTQTFEQPGTEEAFPLAPLHVQPEGAVDPTSRG